MAAADQILQDFQNDTDVWFEIVHTEFFALQVFDVFVQDLSNLPVEQQDGFKNKLSDIIVEKLNSILNLLHMPPACQSLVLQYLSEFAAFPSGDFFNAHYLSIYKGVLGQLQAVHPQKRMIPDAYARGSPDDQAFIQDMAVFLPPFSSVCCV